MKRLYRNRKNLAQYRDFCPRFILSTVLVQVQGVSRAALRTTSKSVVSGCPRKFKMRRLLFCELRAFADAVVMQDASDWSAPRKRDARRSKVSGRLPR